MGCPGRDWITHGRPFPPPPATAPAHQDHGEAEGSAPMQGGGCDTHPCDVLTGPLLPPLPPLLVRPGSGVAQKPCTLRWAQSIPEGQHLAPKVPLCPQPRVGGSREVLPAAWVTQSPATRLQVSRVPGCALRPLPPPCPPEVQHSMSLVPEPLHPSTQPGRGGPSRGTDGDTK